MKQEDDAAQLFFDAEGSRIAVKPCAKGTPHAYAMQHTKAGGQPQRKEFPDLPRADAQAFGAFRAGVERGDEGDCV